jgi:hypothetical protein
MTPAPYFSTTARQAAFLEAAWSWLGTPFSENCAIRGRQGGVDCVRLAAEVLAAAGALSRLELPVLPVEWVRSWHAHHAESRLLEFFAQPVIRERLRRVHASDEPIIGDIAVLKFRQTENHVALWCGDHAVHTSIHAGVIRTSTANPSFSRAIRAFYRVHA